MKVKVDKIEEGPYEGYEITPDVPIYADNEISIDLILNVMLYSSEIKEKDTYKTKAAIHTRPFVPTFIVRARFLRLKTDNSFIEKLWKEQ